MAGRRRRRTGGVEELVLGDLAGGQGPARAPDDRARTDQVAVMVAVQHRPARQDNGRDVDGGGSHDPGRRRLVAAGGQHHCVDRIAVQDLDQRHHAEIAVDGGGRTAAVLKDRVARKFHADAAGVADTLARPLGQLQVDAIARRDVAAGLGEADDRPARTQFLGRDAIVHEALEIERGHIDVAGRLEPFLAAETSVLGGGFAIRHG